MTRSPLLFALVVCSCLGAGEKGRFSIYGLGGYYSGSVDHTAGWPMPTYSPSYLPSYSDDFVSRRGAGLFYGAGLERFWWDNVSLGVSVDKWISADLTTSKLDEQDVVTDVSASMWLIPVLVNIRIYERLNERFSFYGKLGGGICKFAADSFYATGEGRPMANGFRESPGAFAGGGGIQARINSHLAFFAGGEFLFVLYELANLDKEKERVRGVRALAGLKLSTKPFAERPGYYAECLRAGKRLLKEKEHKKALGKFRDACDLKPDSRLLTAIGKLERKVAEELAHYKATAPRFRVGGYYGYVIARRDGRTLGGDISYRKYKWGGGMTRFGLEYEMPKNNVMSSSYELSALIGYLQWHGRKWRLRAGWGLYEEEYEFTLSDSWIYKHEHAKTTSNGPAGGGGVRLGSDSFGLDIEILGFYSLDDTISKKAGYMLCYGGLSIGI